MIYRILIAEDEPSAARYIKNIVEKRCPGFQVQGIAYNGREALEQIRRDCPDVLISDIRMPVMSGIELVRQVREDYPELLSLLVSGYQDFSYARDALRCGVEDYLLKPVNIEQVCQVLEKIRLKLEGKTMQLQLELLELLRGRSGSSLGERLEYYFPDRYYDGAIVRRNGLPSRFALGAELQGGGLREALPPQEQMAGLWVLSGRDEDELLLLKAHRPEEGDLTGWVRCLCGRIRGGYYTAVLSKGPFELERLDEKLAALYGALNTSLVVGKSQLLQENCAAQAQPVLDGLLDTTLENKLEFLASCKKLDELKQEVVCLFAQWEKEGRPQLWVERAIRRLLLIVGRFSAPQNNVVRMELLLDTALHDSASFGELLANIWSLLERMLSNCEKHSARVDVESFFESIDKYVCQNLSQPLTLQSTCELFGISQTYLSRLFRKYKEMSFNDYVTTQRIQESVRLMDEGVDIQIKDVAAIVGYNDPAYFSRVFKSVMGVSPSGYQLERAGKRGLPQREGDPGQAP